MNNANHPQQPESSKHSQEQSKQQPKKIGWWQMRLRTLLVASSLVPPTAHTVYDNAGVIRDWIEGTISAKERELTQDYTGLSSLDRSINQKESIHIKDVPVGQTVCDADVVFVDAGNGVFSPRIILTFKGFSALKNSDEKHLNVAFARAVRYVRDEENNTETPTYYPTASIRNTHGDATQEEIQQLQAKVGQLSPSATNALQPLINSPKNYEHIMMDAGKRQQVCEQIVTLALASSNKPNGLIAGGPGLIQQ